MLVTISSVMRRRIGDGIRNAPDDTKNCYKPHNRHGLASIPTLLLRAHWVSVGRIGFPLVIPGVSMEEGGFPAGTKGIQHAIDLARLVEKVTKLVAHHNTRGHER